VETKKMIKQALAMRSTTLYFYRFIGFETFNALMILLLHFSFCFFWDELTLSKVVLTCKVILTWA
jgi:hypothetical protein